MKHKKKKDKKKLTKKDKSRGRGKSPLTALQDTFFESSKRIEGFDEDIIHGKVTPGAKKTSVTLEPELIHFFLRLQRYEEGDPSTDDFKRWWFYLSQKYGDDIVVIAKKVYLNFHKIINKHPSDSELHELYDQLHETDPTMLMKINKLASKIVPYMTSGRKFTIQIPYVKKEGTEREKKPYKGPWNCGYCGELKISADKDKCPKCNAERGRKPRPEAIEKDKTAALILKHVKQGARQTSRRRPPAARLRRAIAPPTPEELLKEEEEEIQKVLEKNLKDPKFKELYDQVGEEMGVQDDDKAQKRLQLKKALDKYNKTTRGSAKKSKKKKKKDKKKKEKKEKSLKNARILTKKQYEGLVEKRKKKKRLTKKEKKQLDHTLFIKYCRCIKKLKYDPQTEKGLEYPICTSSVYTKRGFTTPKSVKKRCKQYK